MSEPWDVEMIITPVHESYADSCWRHLDRVVEDRSVLPLTLPKHGSVAIIHTSLYTYIYIYIHTHTYIHIYVYIYIYIERERDVYTCSSTACFPDVDPPFRVSYARTSSPKQLYTRTYIRCCLIRQLRRAAAYNEAQ